MKGRYVLALDQGTTSSRALLFDRDGNTVGMGQAEFPQLLPVPGHVEHSPEAIWTTQLESARTALGQANVLADEVAGIGITNQRETTIVWERATGRPVANAIVWQSRITAPVCERLRAEGHEPMVRERTGLVLDAYFSATKIAHLLDQDPARRAAAERGELLFGTVDTWLIWKLTGGRVHVTDVSNASRTSLMDLKTLEWDDELLRLFRVPRAMLPEIRSSSEVLGTTDAKWFGAEIPIAGCAGDQQAATFGQACFTPGEAKNTYGTGCFLLVNAGEAPPTSRHGLLTTVGWRVGGKTTYCLEGSVFIGGAVVQWLRDGLGFFGSAQEIEALAASVPDSAGVELVPAFVGLGAPHWDPFARGTIVGLSRGTTRAHLARAALDSMAQQTCDVLDAFAGDLGRPIGVLKVDGGASVNGLLMQCQADLAGVEVVRPQCVETTALGAAYLAGLGVGFWDDLGAVERAWIEAARFTPRMDEATRRARRRRWARAVERARGWEAPE